MSSRLVEKIRAIEQRHTRCGGSGAGEKAHGVLSTGWAEVDAAIGGGLVRGGLHEWFGLAPALRSDKAVAPDCGGERVCGLSSDERPRRNGDSWRPPVGVLIHLAWRALDADASALWTVWIGRRCFPYPAVLLRRAGEDRLLLERSLFVSPRNPADRLWAIDLALRSPAVGVVIADGGEFAMAATRRIQCVARNHGALALLVRPPWERDELSAAHTRWLMRQVSAASANPTWSIELLRCKGVQFGMALNVWRLEWDRAACTLHLSAALGDQAGAAQAETADRGRNGRIDETLRRRFA